MLLCTRCNKLGRPLQEAPYPGELGERIMRSICEDCWNEWTAMQIRVINEYRLNLGVREHRQTLAQQMEAFLFPTQINSKDENDET